MIREEICTYEVCKLAKEKGFPLRTDCPWDFPTQSLLQRWLRQEKGIFVEVLVDDDSNTPLTYNIHQYKDCNWECVCHHHGNYYAANDWELCLEDALKYALENLV